MADIQKLLEEVKGMTVLELNELVKALEEEFGVSAAAPVAVAAAPAAGAAAAPGLRHRRARAKPGAAKIIVRHTKGSRRRRPSRVLHLRKIPRRPVLRRDCLLLSCRKTGGGRNHRAVIPRFPWIFSGFFLDFFDEKSSVRKKSPANVSVEAKKGRQ